MRARTRQWALISAALIGIGTALIFALYEDTPPPQASVVAERECNTCSARHAGKLRLRKHLKTMRDQN